MPRGLSMGQGYGSQEGSGQTFGVVNMACIRDRDIKELKCHRHIMANVAVYAMQFELTLGVVLWGKGRRTLEVVKTKIWRC